MAERRMFARTIIDSDAFLEMPLSTQALYFHLNMRADDDGFVNNPRKIQRTIGSSEDDLKVLLAKRFILSFQSGVIVIKHWKMNNLIRKDRYQPTIYQDEISTLTSKENGSYTERLPSGQPNDNQRLTQYRLGKGSIGEESIGKDATNGTYSFFLSHAREFLPEDVVEKHDLACKQYEEMLRLDGEDLEGDNV